MMEKSIINIVYLKPMFLGILVFSHLHLKVLKNKILIKIRYCMFYNFPIYIFSLVVIFVDLLRRRTFRKVLVPL